MFDTRLASLFACLAWAYLICSRHNQGAEMERLVGWWCLLIGVTDKGAIHVATGVVAALLLVAIPLLIIGLLRYRR
jgi:membrane-bound ClpP family serine protease